jgi:5-formyltetrahydrofolate cyclo-ligase
MTDTKTHWRRKLLALRRTLEEHPRATHSATIVSRLAALPEFASCTTLLLYEALGAEVDLGALAEVAARSGKLAYRPNDADDLSGWPALGIDAHTPPFEVASPPPAGSRVALLVVVPGVGFDRRGTRLGRGRGFYDRTLAALRKHHSIVAVGVAFELQIVETLPRDPWDQPVDLIATESRLIVPQSAPRLDPGRDAEEVHNP